MVVGEFALVCATKRRLTSERVGNAELLPHHDTGSRFFRFLNGEGAVLVTKEVGVLVEQAREDSLLESVILATRVAITEDVLLSGVAVQVENEEDISVLLKFLHHHLIMVDRRLHFPRRINPTPIEVNSGQIASGVTVDYTIRIQKRHNFEDKVVSKYLGIE